MVGDFLVLSNTEAHNAFHDRSRVGSYGDSAKEAFFCDTFGVFLLAEDYNTVHQRGCR